jgi:peptide deformylase
MLQKKAVRVDPKARSTRYLVSKLVKYLTEYKSVGIAAPQIGVSKQVAIALMVFPAETIVLINPVVLKREMLTQVAEGCLSMEKRGTYLARRPNKITFVTQLPSGKFTTLIKTGKMANIIDHEIEHLKGICGGKR